ncbi:hypothetical protein GQ568_03455, partial [Patescibacteria group bacterium]|nr:hypothetical protein [Patescibacteria group bacterium]
MNILNKIKNKWDFSKSVEQNTIYFNTRENQEKKARKKMLFYSLIVIAVAMFFNNPLLGMAMIIGAITYGSEYVFNSAVTEYVSVSALDSTHFVVVYKDGGNSSYGTAIVGTISGTTISYGSEYTFRSGNTEHISVSTLDSTHFVVSYLYSAAGYSVIGVVSSGDTITFGTTYQFISTSISEISVTALDSTHFAVAFKDAVASNYGNSFIGVVSSGDVISYGSKYTFNAAAIAQTAIAALDSTHFVIAFVDSGNSSYGTAIIGVVSSGDVITYGSEYVYVSGWTGRKAVTALDSTHFVVVDIDGANSYYAFAAVGVVSSGDTITYGSKYTYKEAGYGYISVSALDST